MLTWTQIRGAARAQALATLVVALTVLVAASARAESAANVAAARQLGAEGVTLARAGNCAEAIDKLTRAEALYHAPTILVELGYCQCELGQLVEGTEALNRVVRENLGDAPPQAFVDAQSKASTLLAEYTPKLANLVIKVQAPEGAAYEVKVDDKVVPLALIGMARPSDPGRRTISATGAGLEPIESRVTLEEGASAEVNLTFERSAPAALDTPPAPSAAASSTDPTQDTPSRDGPNLVPATIGFGVGAIGLGLGTAFGLSAASTQSDLDAECRSGSCPPGSQDEIDSMTTNANIATAGFAVGVLGLGAGLYFLLTADSPGDAGATCQEAPCVSPLIGLGRLGMEGVF
jgi:hypothetical protein